MKYLLTVILIVFLTTVFYGQEDLLRRYDNLEKQYLASWESRSFDRLGEILDQLYQTADDLDDASLLIEVLLRRHHYEVYIRSNSNSGFIALDEALAIAQQNGLDDHQMNILTTMAIFQFGTYSDFDTAEDYVRQMTQLNGQLKSVRYELAIGQLECQIYSFRRFNELEVSQERYNTCTETLTKTLEYFEPSDFILYRQARFTAVFGFSDFFGDDLCTKYLDELEYQPNLPVVNQNEYFVVWFRLVHLHRQNKYNEVLALVEQSADLVSRLSTPTLKYHYAILSKTYEEMGLYRESLEASKQMSFYTKKQTEKAFSDKLNARRQAQKAEQFASDNAGLKRRNYIISLLTILTLIGLVATFYFYNGLKRQTKVIQLQKDELAIVNKSKNKLFAILAHDLRGPISSLHNLSKNVKYLISKKEWKTLDQMGGDINAKLENLDSLLGNIIPWVMSQIKNPRLKKEKIELGPLIDRCVKEFDDKIRTKNISISNTVAGTSIETDKDAMQIIIRNILSNALKFSPQDSEISIVSKLSNGKTDIFIRDQGEGIAQDKLEQIFTDYESTDGQDGEKGHGLGLKLSKDLALWLGANLEIQSSTTDGTTVRLSI